MKNLNINNLLKQKNIKNDIEIINDIYNDPAMIDKLSILPKKLNDIRNINKLYIHNIIDYINTINISSNDLKNIRSKFYNELKNYNIVINLDILRRKDKIIFINNNYDNISDEYYIKKIYKNNTNKIVKLKLNNAFNDDIIDIEPNKSVLFKHNLINL